jgi:hypothetical protein
VRDLALIEPIEIVRSDVPPPAVGDLTLALVFLGAADEDTLSRRLDAWWPKVRSSGWLTGARYDDPAVARAVAAFAEARGVPLACVTRDAQPDWAFQRPPAQT